MKYIDIDFPDELYEYFSGGAEFSTSISTMKNKREIRNRNWDSPRFRYKLQYKECNDEIYRQLHSFFILCGGSEIAFNFVDKNDCKLENQILPKDTFSNNDNQFLIVKTYSYQQQSFNRNVYNVRNEEVFINGNKLSQEQYAIQQNPLTINNEIQINQNDVVSINADFAVIVRFDCDFLPVKKKSFNAIELPDISLIETLI